MTKDIFDARRRTFEEEYAKKNDAQLIDKLEALFNRHIDRETIRQATGITDERVLDNLIALNLSGDLMAAFKLYPLVEMAWADGHADERETRAVLDSVEHHGMSRDSAAYEMLARALKNHPRPDTRKAWYSYAEELCTTLNPQELASFRDDLLEHARKVAEASGGILNVALTVSDKEKRILEAIRRALTPGAP